MKRMSNIRQPIVKNLIGNNLGLDIFNQKPEKKAHCNNFVSHYRRLFFVIDSKADVLGNTTLFQK